MFDDEELEAVPAIWNNLPDATRRRESSLRGSVGLDSLDSSQSGDSDPLLSLQLSVNYTGRTVLRDLALRIGHGEILGLVGESGSGKSTLALSILRLLEFKGGHATGKINFQGCDLMRLTEQDMRRVRGKKISLVLQSPIASLNPNLRIGVQLQEAWRTHARSTLGQHQLSELLNSVSLPMEESFLLRYPRQLSVGLAQRVLIALAILHRPALLIADEPTSALDTITQSDILRLLTSLNRTLGMGVLFISHDLLTLASICHRIAILYGGTIVEVGPTESIFRRPSHPYTQRLLQAVPKNP